MTLGVTNQIKYGPFHVIGKIDMPQPLLVSMPVIVWIKPHANCQTWRDAESCHLCLQEAIMRTTPHVHLVVTKIIPLYGETALILQYYNQE